MKFRILQKILILITAFIITRSIPPQSLFYRPANLTELGFGYLVLFIGVTGLLWYIWESIPKAWNKLTGRPVNLYDVIVKTRYPDSHLGFLLELAYFISVTMDGEYLLFMISATEQEMNKIRREIAKHPRVIEVTPKSYVEE